MSVLGEVDDRARHVLGSCGFDPVLFEALRSRYLGGSLAAGVVSGTIEPPRDEDLVSLPGSSEELERIGRDALQAREIGVIALNGGMATRFGGGVKGIVEVFDGYTFLDCTILDAQRWSAPVFVMNSFATDEATRAFVDGRSYDVHSFLQRCSIRLEEDGLLFRTARGVSLCSTGHGDLARAFAAQELDGFLARGGRYLFVSNVDNALTTLDPIAIGAHVSSLRSGAQLSIEVVERDRAHPSGGKPVRVDGSLRIVESFRFPDGLDPRDNPYHSTNAMLIDASALRRSFDLDWYAVRKTVDDRTAVQFEQLLGDLSAHLETRCLVVPHTGSGSRFAPIKSREHLEQRRTLVRDRLVERRIIDRAA